MIVFCDGPARASQNLFPASFASLTLQQIARHGCAASPGKRKTKNALFPRWVFCAFHSAYSAESIYKIRRFYAWYPHISGAARQTRPARAVLRVSRERPTVREREPRKGRHGGIPASGGVRAKRLLSAQARDSIDTPAAFHPSHILLRFSCRPCETDALCI